MSDYLQNKQLQLLIRTLGIPLPVPALLNRDHQLLGDHALANQTIKVKGLSDADDKNWEKWLQGVGASTPDGATEYAGLLVDAGNMSSPANMEEIYTFLHAHVKQVAKSGKIVLVWNNAATTDESSVASAAMVGLCKSLAKELGGKGISVNGLSVRGNKTGALGAAIFLLSGHSAFITAQVLEVNGGSDAPQFSLLGKHALVTGGARGIGAETVRALARQGATVGIIDVQPLAEDGNALAVEVGGWFLQQDITATDAAQHIAQAVKEKGGLDILVNNAGITRDKTIAKMPPHFWQQAFEVNLLSMMRITDYVLKENIMAKQGRIISLSSIAGIAGNVGQTNYAATKAGVIGYTRFLSATAGKSITANAIAPGFIETQMTANLPFFIKEGGRRLSALKQGGIPQDIAEAISFLASPGAQGISGQVLRVCGGSFLGA